jgi:molecular chaperone GrpE
MDKNEEKKDNREKVRVSQKILFYDRKQNNFLLVKIKNEEGWYAKNLGLWEFPGGTLEEGETLEESLKREISEEIGDIEYNFIDIIYFKEYDPPSGHKIALIYLAEYMGGKLRLSEEHSDFKWVSANEVVNDKKEYRDWILNSIKRAAEYLEKESALDSWKRCQADFENYKKSQVRHQDEFRKYAKMDLIEQILPVVDNFEASLAHVPEKSKENKWVEGIVYIKKQLEDVLRNNDIEEIAVKLGDKFNPEIHEAVGGDGKKQKVARVIQKGYKIDGRILRAARVEVE